MLSLCIFSASQISNSPRIPLRLGLELGCWEIFLSDALVQHQHPCASSPRKDSLSTVFSFSSRKLICLLLSLTEACCGPWEAFSLLCSCLSLGLALCAWASEVGLSHICVPPPRGSLAPLVSLALDRTSCLLPAGIDSWYQFKILGVGQFSAFYECRGLFLYSSLMSNGILLMTLGTRLAGPAQVA